MEPILGLPPPPPLPPPKMFCPDEGDPKMLPVVGVAVFGVEAALPVFVARLKLANDGAGSAGLPNNPVACCCGCCGC